jgi:predicted GNAT family acetyltransferase
MKPSSDMVRHNAERSRFELDTPAGLAVADYRLSGDTMTIFHTEVSLSLRGNGIGEQLVLGTLPRSESSITRSCRAAGLFAMSWHGIRSFRTTPVRSGIRLRCERAQPGPCVRALNHLAWPSHQPWRLPWTKVHADDITGRNATKVRHPREGHGRKAYAQPAIRAKPQQTRAATTSGTPTSPRTQRGAETPSRPRTSTSTRSIISGSCASRARRSVAVRAGQTRWLAGCTRLWRSYFL